jgi:hypothetical protein
MKRYSQTVIGMIALVLSISANAQSPHTYVPQYPHATRLRPNSPQMHQNEMTTMPSLPRSSADLTIAGNVRGGKHFRGSVPYHAKSAFQGELGTSYLDSFFRHSRGVNDGAPALGAVAPFYSPSSTVTRTVPGQSGVIHPSLSPISPMNTRITTGSTDTLSSWAWGQSAYTTSSNDQAVARALLQLDTHAFPLSTQAQTNRWLRQQQGLLDTPVLDRAPFSTDPLPEQSSAAEKPVPDPSNAEDAVLDPMATLQALTSEQWAAYFQTLQTDDGGTFRAEQRPSVTSTTAPPDAGPQPLSQPTNRPSAPNPAALTGTNPGASTLEAYTEARYLHFMVLGRRHLEQGHFSEAENAYALAGTYKPDDPWAHAGKCQAFFAMHQYSTSALFLARALDGLPEYAQISIDLEALVGGKEQLLKRIGELERFVTISPCFDLYFLLAYTYYQTQDLGLAQEAIHKAIEKTPQHKGARAVNQAINKKIGFK